MAAPRIALAWQIGSTSGWGLYGLQIALHLTLSGRAEPLLLEPPAPSDPRLIERHVLRKALAQQPAIAQELVAMAPDPKAPRRLPLPVFHARGNHAAVVVAGQWSRVVGGSRNIGLIFSEDTDFHADELARLGSFDVLVAGSSWNAEVLREAGLPKTQVNIQGVDPGLYHPGPRTGLFPDRFVIFSGGKLEHRKGQDLVLAAFRAFRQRHPEALLIAAWHNLWPQSLGVRHLATSFHATAVPLADNGSLDVDRWCVDNGVPLGSFITARGLPPPYLARLMREADVALFANRCEGGTNLVAMEAMACGLPTILSANTGHLDLIADGRCLALSRQRPVALEDVGTVGWGESEVEEMVEALEYAYRNRDAAQALGRQAAAFMTGHSWAKAVHRLADLAGLGPP